MRCVFSVLCRQCVVFECVAMSAQWVALAGAWMSYQRYGQVAKIWVRAGEGRYVARLSLYGSTGEKEKQTLLGRGYGIVLLPSLPRP